MAEIQTLCVAYGPFVTLGCLALFCGYAIAGLGRGRTLRWLLPDTAGLLLHVLLCRAQWQAGCMAEGTIAPMLRTLVCLGAGAFLYLLLLAAAGVYLICTLLERTGEKAP